MSPCSGNSSAKANKRMATPQEIPVNAAEGERLGPQVAKKLLSPVNRHAILASQFAGAVAASSDGADQPTIVDWALELRDRLDAAATGDLKIASAVFTAQALSLDGIFTEMARRAGALLRQPDACERYMRIALKAQAASRQSLEALARLHQPREQTVRHVHVNDGGQAIVADQFHAHIGGAKNGTAVIQCHEPSASPAAGAALSGQDATGNSLPVPQDKKPKALQDARGQRGRTERKPQRLEARSPLSGNTSNA